MIFLETTLSAYDLGAVGLMFLIAVGLLKLLSKKLEADKERSCRAFEKGCCPLSEDFKSLVMMTKEIWDVHLGNRAIGEDGIPRWYLQDSAMKKINEIHNVIAGLRNLTKTHLNNTRTGEKPSEESVNMFNKICVLIDELQKSTKVLTSKERKV